jgi:hypothetical protein
MHEQKQPQTIEAAPSNIEPNQDDPIIAYLIPKEVHQGLLQYFTQQQRMCNRMLDALETLNPIRSEPQPPPQQEQKAKEAQNESPPQQE